VSNFCEHCQGQRFDRARALRALRQIRADLRRTGDRATAEEALALALKTVATLDIPHLDSDEEEPEVVH
jgi:hypothetical protein